VSATRRRPLFALSATLSLLVVLSMVALATRQRCLTRGMPRELPGPNPHAAMEAIAAAGFGWIKQPLPLGDDSGFEPLVREATALGLNVVPLLDGDPAADYAPPADPAVFGDWAGEFAARYGDQITYYQIWDEPNLGSHWGWEPVNPAGYAALLAAAHDAVTAADPDAVIIAAALAPNDESGPENLSDVDYLAALYELGADAYFDVAAGKPYGFDTGPDDLRVGREVLNFSRLILLWEVMARHGDYDAALWAGNFGWNALPAGWEGRPSIWGQTDPLTQAEQTRAAYQRAVHEWPWAGVLFLENYAPAAPADDPRWGFALVDTDLAPRSPLLAGRLVAPIPHYQLPDPGVQSYEGGWRFQPAYGADISQSGDRVTIEFEGTDFGIRVRRGDYRAYFYVTVDGQPANALPTDERGAYLCLTSADQSGDDVVTVPVARHLSPGRHTAELVAERGWDQWALVGFSAADLPDERPFRWTLALLGVAALGLAVGAYGIGRTIDWADWGRGLRAAFGRLGQVGQVVLTAGVAALFALSGALTWLHPAGGAFRRLGDGPQTVLLAAVAALFYFSPWLILNIISGLALLVLIFWRLDLGLALVALSAPFYVYPKPLLGYRFSMVEMVLLMTVAAGALDALLKARRRSERGPVRHSDERSEDTCTGASAGENLHSRTLLGFRTGVISCPLPPLDLAVGFFLAVATLSLLFTERLDVATNEWRVVVLEPVLFYLLLRASQLKEEGVWRVVDGFVLGGVIVGLLGLGWYAAGEHVITAEGGLPRLRSIYGSPNNVGLYLGRVIPVLLAVALTGRGRRRWLYGLALLPALAAAGLSFSKGALLLGLPVGIGLVLLCWRGRKAAAVLGGLAVLALIGLLVGSQIPALEGRLSLSGATTDFRVSLWKASAAMIRDHPWTGVGLDNFLYAYRGRYIRPEAWQEPSLSHPHNLLLDFWSRLGVLGLAAGVWLQVAFWRLALRLFKRTGQPSGATRPLLIGLMGAMGATLAHGLVDQTYFLIDLAYAFMLTIGLLAWLGDHGDHAST
jgi:O-antigen ligase